MRLNSRLFDDRKTHAWRRAALVALFVALASAAAAPIVRAQGTAPTQGPVKITLDDAIQLALKHNHALLAAQTTILQDQALEVQANLRPNPTFFTDWEYLPLGSPTSQNSRLYPEGYTLGQYLHDNTEADMGLSYLFERGKKRQARLQAAQDVTAQTRSLVADNERTLTFNVASQFVSVQLAESTLDLATLDVKSFQQTTDISEYQYKIGGMSEGDFLAIKLQLLQYQTDYEQAVLAKDTALDDLRNMIGYESVPADYDVAGPFDYEPLKANLEDLQMKAIANRPDLRAAQQGVTAATSQWEVQKSIGKQDVTATANYSHVNGINAATWNISVPLPVFNRNQGNIEQARYAITQSQELEKGASDQVLTDVHDAYVTLHENDTIVVLYRSGYLDAAVKAREIEKFAYEHGGASLLDWLNAERTYRVTELAYRQALASYLTALEQLREAVGVRTLP
ncbi:MAG TPA: TolC family protein [Candidatus Acidoferrum sp.]|nr:TolC family protein [Candidatus Acidoferrum sp.]